MCFMKTISLLGFFTWNYIIIQTFLQMVPSLANYQIWWPYMNSRYVTFYFYFYFYFFCRNNLRILKLKLTYAVIVKHNSDMENRKV